MYPKTKTKSHKIFILIAAMAIGFVANLHATAVKAAILFQDDNFAEVDSGGLIIDFSDQYLGDLVIQFGNTLGETISWSVANNRFEISDDLDLTNHELTTARIENVSTLPGGGAGLTAGDTGRVVQLTATDSVAPGCTNTPNCQPGSYTWDGTSWYSMTGTGGSSGYAQTITVAKSGGNFTSVKSALDSITDASTSKRYIVHIYPGIYTEAPMTIPDYVSILGMGNRGNVSIVASNTSSPLVTAGTASMVSNVNLEGATASECYTTSVTSYLNDIGFKDCQTGLRSTSATGDLHAWNVFVHEGTFTDIAKIDGTGYAHITTIIVHSATATNAISVTDDTSSLELFQAEIESPNVTNGLYTNNSVEVVMTNTVLEEATYGIHMGPTGSGSITGDGGILDANTTHDIFVESSTATLFLSAFDAHEETFNIDPNASVILSFSDSEEGEESFSIFGELHVGTPERPRESVFGEGDSYTNGMMVYSYNTSTYTDVSTAAISYTGSTFTIPGTAVDNALYISSNRKDDQGNFVQFLGYKLSTAGTALVEGGGEVVHEYWNGSSWVEFDVLCTHSGFLYRYDQQCFLRANSSEHVRFDEAMTDDWALNDPPSTGTNRYWIRIRVKTAITTTPVFEQFKIHSNRTEINGDGTMSYHGTARELRTFVLSPETIFYGRGSNAPDNRAFTVGTGGVSWTDERDNAAFAGGGSVIEEITGSIALPKGIDTSSGLKIRIYWSKVNANAGDVEWKVDYVVNDVRNINIADGANIEPAPRTTEQALTTNPGVTVQTTATGDGFASNAPIMSEFTTKLDISDCYEGDTIFLRLYRDPTDPDDTYTNDAIMLGFEVSGVFWTTGEKL